MRYGYARVSTIDQDTGAQMAMLRMAKCDAIVEEKRSAVKTRPELDNLLAKLQQGDELIIYKLDRLARSLNHLLSILEHVQERGAKLRSLTEPIDPDTPAGRMFIQVLGSVAEFERALIRERCMAGQLEALRQGKRIGRPHKLSPQDMSEVIQLYGSGIPSRAIADAYGLSDTRVRGLWLEATGQKKRNFGQIRALL